MRNWSNSTSDMWRVALQVHASLLRRGPETPSSSEVLSAHPSCGKKHRGPIPGIAGGSDLAPVKAVAETALARNMGQPIDVYFGVRASRDLYMVEHFRELSMLYGNLSFVPVLSQAGRRSDQVGVVAAEDFSDLDGWKAHLAGPAAMIDATAPLSIERGIRATFMQSVQTN